MQLTQLKSSRALTAAIVGLTLATAYIHLSLGGLLFTLNAAGYAALAAAIALAATASHPLVRRFDWLPRVGLGGYTVTTIAAYLVMGPYFSLGWMEGRVGLRPTLTTTGMGRRAGLLRRLNGLRRSGCE